MTVTANALLLKQKIQNFKNALAAAPYTMVDVATDVIGEVSQSALSNLSGRDDQVGFDLAQFLDNIRTPSSLEIRGRTASISILDVRRMGTQEDFEAIAYVPELWHSHQRRGEAFRTQLYDYPELREALAQRRQQIWGTKTPQWWLLEHGYSGGGAYPAVPASHFIAEATEQTKIQRMLYAKMQNLFDRIPK